MQNNKKKLDNNKVRVIKISKEAIFEFINEKFIESLKLYFDVDPLTVSGSFDINWQRGEFIFCTYNSEDKNKNTLFLSNEINLQNLMKNLQDTTCSMFSDNRYKEYTKQELIDLSQKSNIKEN